MALVHDEYVNNIIMCMTMVQTRTLVSYNNAAQNSDEKLREAKVASGEGIYAGMLWGGGGGGGRDPHKNGEDPMQYI